MGSTPETGELLAAANFKINPGTLFEVSDWAIKFLQGFRPRAGVSVAICPPAPAISIMESRFRGKLRIRVGAQNVHWETNGAFTGELSVSMLRSCGGTVAIVGHSERRHIFGETDEMVAKRARAALESSLMTILCIGEKLEEREAGQTEAVLQRQLDASVSGLEPQHLKHLVIAYEPVWAIGTGLTPTAEDVESLHGLIRADLEKRFSNLGSRIRILYGGSVSVNNVKSFVERRNVNGVLVGGASLDPDGWNEIILKMAETIE